VVPPVEVAIHALLPQVVMRVVFLVDMLLADTAICNSEVLIKTVSL
jgi:hypothetical protein